MFANQQMARAAAEKEIEEAKARTVAQRALADAQSQAAARALTVAKEKAANEAKSEFMSLMCHEVRTPLNGCLASAEMLLETKLEVAESSSLLLRHYCQTHNYGCCLRPAWQIRLSLICSSCTKNWSSFRQLCLFAKPKLFQNLCKPLVLWQG